jgi:Zn-dependent M28 family amino/carboxypeptidase
MRNLSIKGLLIPTTFFLLTGCTSQEKIPAVSGEMDGVITVAEVERIEKVLAADEMQGRKAFTPGIDKAADFIAEEFKAAGLNTWEGSGGFKQDFVMVRTRPVSTIGNFDEVTLEPKDIIVVSSQPEVRINAASGYEKTRIAEGANLSAEARKLIRSGKNLLVTVDKSFAAGFSNLGRMRSTMFKTSNNVVFVLDNKDPVTYEIDYKQEVTEQKLANVVGVLPGKSRKDEYVIFSGHYDHLGIGKPVNGDSIYNGANDDAAGITAVIMLAKYFKKLDNNERTIVFAAFTAEEVGGFGSQYFSRQFDAEKVMAMFNIEMIGTESKWGKNAAYITGFERTNMGTILQKNLEGSLFTFHPDPYPTQQLFYRSDNATLARLGVPAHTISTSKMDNEPNYHKVTDHVETLDLDNMTRIIKAIALSSKTIVAGVSTPSRVKVEELR